MKKTKKTDFLYKGKSKNSQEFSQCILDETSPKIKPVVESMPKINMPISREEGEDPDVKFLQDFSQCAFDILQIVKTVIQCPGEYKELQDRFFRPLLNSLNKTMTHNVDFSFRDKKYIIPIDFLYFPYNEEAEQKVLNKAKNNLRFLVYDIEEKRRVVMKEDYKPITGIKNPELKAMLEEIKNGKTGKSVTTNEDVVTFNEQEKKYYYKKKLMIFKNDETLYKKIFNIIFKYKNEDNYISYEDIISHFKEEGIPKGKSDQNIAKIQAQVTRGRAGLNKAVTIGGNLLCDIIKGNKLITVEQGKGVKLNNKEEIL